MKPSHKEDSSMIADASLVVKSYIPERKRKRVCTRNTQEQHTRGESEAGMHSKHPRAAYQRRVRSGYALETPKSCIPEESQKRVCTRNTQELHTYASKKPLRCIQKKGAESSPQEALSRERTRAYAAKGEGAS